MRIVIDARSAGPELSGISRYVLGLLRGLSEVGAADRITVLAREPRLIEEYLSGRSSFDLVRCPAKPLSARGQLVVPRLLRRLRASLYHAPYLDAPLRPGRLPVVITIHDLIPHRFPQGVARSMKVRLLPLWNAWSRAQVRRADAIVTVSDFSRNEVIEFFDVSPEKVVRIYNGVDAPNAGTHGQNVRATRHDVRAAERLRDRFRLNGHIVSYIGRHDPYKNITALVRAFEIAAERMDEPMTLVIAGRENPRYPALREAARDSGVNDRIVWTGYLDDDDREALLRASDVFVFPSKYEGFGLPPLEAMAAGVPVVASNATSLPEVLGDAATLINPDDQDAIADAIVELIRNNSLRAARIESGRTRAAQFTWRRCAEEHLALYETLVQRRP